MTVENTGKKLGQTPSQTVGPFFAYGLTPAQFGYGWLSSVATSKVAPAQSSGERICIHGTVYDGARNPVPDALVEIWQPNEQGRFFANSENGFNDFEGFGRCGTSENPDALGAFSFETIKPGGIPEENRIAPAITVLVFARGLLNHLYTRLYFSDHPTANNSDAILTQVPLERRSTLIAQRQNDGPISDYIWDIHLQGEQETVFFDL